MMERPPFLTHLQEQIETRRAQLGLSMRDLSLKAGLNETAVKAIITGRSKSPRGDTLQALATVLGTTVQELLGKPGGSADSQLFPAAMTQQEELFEALQERERQLAREIKEHARRSEVATARLDEVRAMIATLSRSPAPDREPPAAPTTPPRPTGTDPPPFREQGNRVARNPDRVSAEDCGTPSGVVPLLPRRAGEERR